MMKAIRSLQTRVDRFLFAGCDPSMASVFRIGFAILLLINTAVWMTDANRWFANDGVLSIETARKQSPIFYPSLFFLIEPTSKIIWGSLAILMMQALCLLVGYFSRLQALCIFFWLVSFQHRNPMICDGEDTVLRLFAVFMIWMPLDAAWSLGRWLHHRQSIVPSEQAWALRLVQIEMTLIYVSATIAKLSGATWRDGSAMFLVFRMDDYMGRSPLPESWLASPWLIRSMTWSSLAIELLLPILLWLRPTRRLAIVVGVLFHLAIECTLNLFLFEWIMILGLISFCRMSDFRRASE